jgi:hypothetical protein
MIADTIRWPNARHRLPAADCSATPTHITRVQRRRRDETVGVSASEANIAASRSGLAPSTKAAVATAYFANVTAVISSIGSSMAFTRSMAAAAALPAAAHHLDAIGAEIIEPAIDQVIAHCLVRVAAGLALSTAKSRALSRHRRKPSGIGVPERVHFTEF